MDFSSQLHLVKQILVRLCDLKSHNWAHFFTGVISLYLDCKSNDSLNLKLCRVQWLSFLNWHRKFVVIKSYIKNCLQDDIINSAMMKLDNLKQFCCLTIQKRWYNNWWNDHSSFDMRRCIVLSCNILTSILHISTNRNLYLNSRKNRPTWEMATNSKLNWFWTSYSRKRKAWKAVFIEIRFYCEKLIKT